MYCLVTRYGLQSVVVNLLRWKLQYFLSIHFLSKLQYFLSLKYILSIVEAKQIINVLLVNNFYPADTPTRSKEKENDELLCTVWSLVMVRNQLPAQMVKLRCFANFEKVPNPRRLKQPQAYTFIGIPDSFLDNRISCEKRGFVSENDIITSIANEILSPRIESPRVQRMIASGGRWTRY